MNVLDSGEADGDASIDNYGAALCEEEDSGLVEAGVRTGITQSVIEEVEVTYALDMDILKK